MSDNLPNNTRTEAPSRQPNMGRLHFYKVPQVVHSDLFSPFTEALGISILIRFLVEAHMVPSSLNSIHLLVCIHMSYDGQVQSIIRHLKYLIYSVIRYCFVIVFGCF